MEEGWEFPHEMGVLLGYPAEDVEGFIRNGGDHFLYAGYWKVYEDLSAKMQLFCRFEAAEKALLEMVSNGVSISEIVSARMGAGMDKIYVVYWSQTGNTQAMAEAVGRGLKEAGKEAEVLEVGSVPVAELKKAKGFALGCPAMGAEVLEETEMEPFVCEAESFAAGKTIALFGSYGWGDGQWMRDWVERMNGAGAGVLDGEGLICPGTPDDSVLTECADLGRRLASKI